MTQDEAIPESLKNILLVMVDGGYLEPPSKDEKPSQIWEETWKRVDRSLPSLFRDIIPEPKATGARIDKATGLLERPEIEAEPERDGRKEAETEVKTENVMEES